MSTASVAPAPVLADRVVSRSAVADVVLMVTGAVLVGLLAQVRIPLGFTPVPITGQTLGVLLVGGSLGMWRGIGALSIYLVAGVAGVPWFSGRTGGWEVVQGATFGYIIGFVLAAGLIGWLAQRTWDRTPVLAMAGFVLASLVPFAIGLPYLAVALGISDVGTVLELGFTPFIFGGVVKAAVAAVAFPLAWRLTRSLDERR